MAEAAGLPGVLDIENRGWGDQREAALRHVADRRAQLQAAD